MGLDVQIADNVLKESGLPFAGNDLKVSEEVFQMKSGDISRLFRIGDDYAVVQVLEKKKERIPDLDEVRNLVENDFIKEQALLSAAKKAESIIEALLKSPADFESIAKQNNLEWTDLDPLSRTSGFVPGLGKSPAVSEMLASLSMSAPIFPQPLLLADGAAVVRLTRVDRASDELFAKESSAFGAWVSEVRKTELLKGWIRALKDKSSIEMNQKLM